VERESQKLRWETTVQNLTLAVEEEVLKRARLRALEEGTSVNALVRAYLEAYSGVRSQQKDAIARLVELGRKSTGGSEGQRWTREEIYEDRLPRPSK
jgi:hypothetical protein